MHTKSYVPLYATPTDDTSTLTSSSSSSPASTPPVTTTKPPTPEPTPEQTTNTGAIAGGVVGGVAVIALAGGAIAFIVLRNKRRRQTAQPDNSTIASGPVMAAVGGYGHHPPPPGSHASYMHDPRASMAVKSPHESMYSSNMGSPVPDSGSPGFGQNAYTPVSQTMASPAVVSPESYGGHPYYQPGQYVAELPEATTQPVTGTTGTTGMTGTAPHQ
jgi:hypothetical protein